ncbi:hypothetical protein KEM54_004776, partial [Ascosphaera aggregata]
LDAAFSPFDLKRLDSYANNLLDYHVILDLVPTLAEFYFSGRLGSKVNLSGIQQSILLGVGLQRKTFEDIEKELKVASNQLMAMFIKIARKISVFFRSVLEEAVGEQLPAADAGVAAHAVSGAHDQPDEEKFKALDVTLEDELRMGAQEIDSEMREKQKALIDALPLE